MRNLLAHMPRSDQAMAAAALRTVFAQPNQDAAHQQLRVVHEVMENRHPKAAQVLIDAEVEILVYIVFPQEHWKQTYTINVLECLDKEVKRRTNVVGIFPEESSNIRLVGALLQEQSEGWQNAKRYISMESKEKLFDPHL